MSLTRINPSGENPFALGKIHFAFGKNVFDLEQFLFALREKLFALGEIVFGLWKVESILREILFGFREVEFMFKEFVCHRDVTERRSKMIESFDFQIPTLRGDQASISRISNCQQPPKNTK